MPIWYLDWLRPHKKYGVYFLKLTSRSPMSTPKHVGYQWDNFDKCPQHNEYSGHFLWENGRKNLCFLELFVFGIVINCWIFYHIFIELICYCIFQAKSVHMVEDICFSFECIKYANFSIKRNPECPRMRNGSFIPLSTMSILVFLYLCLKSCTIR